MALRFYTLIAAVLLNSAVLSLSADIAQALEIRHTLLKNAELVQLEFPARASECRIQRIEKKTLKISLLSGENLPEVLAKTIAKSSLILDVESDQGGILIRFKSPDFGYVADTKAAKQHLSLYLFHDSYGGRWKSITRDKQPPVEQKKSQEPKSTVAKTELPGSTQKKQSTKQKISVENKTKRCESPSKITVPAINACVKAQLPGPSMPEAMHRSWHFAPRQNRNDGLYDLKPRLIRLPQPGL